MTTSKGDASSFLGVVNADDFQREVAQVRAKAVLAEVLEGELPSYNWTYSPARLVRNSIGAGFALESATTPEQREVWAPPALRLARLWESLAKIQEGTTTETALLNAAVTYEYAGYQANAACLARAVAVRDDDVRPTLEQLVALFLRRWLVRLRIDGEAAAGEPDIPSDPDYVLEAVALALAARGLAEASRYLIGGNSDAYNEAIQRLGEAHSAYAELGAPIESNLAGTIASLLPVLRTRSTWEVVGGLINDAVASLSNTAWTGNRQNSYRVWIGV
jgi:hypothetical protein